MSNPKYMKRGLAFARGNLIEEIGELQSEMCGMLVKLGRLQKALGKSLRYGLDGYNPELPEDKRVTNEAWIQCEINDILCTGPEPSRIWEEMMDVASAIKRLELELAARTDRGWDLDTDQEDDVCDIPF